jgi:addiction module RelB/DinJ family antitoxin
MYIIVENGGAVMSKTEKIVLRIDADLKKEVEAILNCLGLSISSGIMVFLRQIAMRRELPFRVSLNKPTAGDLAVFSVSNVDEPMFNQDAKDTMSDLSRSFDDVDEMMKEILS